MSNARWTTDTDPLHVVLPDSDMMAVIPLSPKLPETVPSP
jgi:hypothetical protein